MPPVFTIVLPVKAPVAVSDVALATPKVGVTSVGEVFITNVDPVPVCEVTVVVLPDDEIGPERSALVVTVAALPVILPVRFPVKPVDVTDVNPVIVAGKESVTDPVLPEAVI